jgi:hypothetical protein
MDWGGGKDLTGSGGWGRQQAWRSSCRREEQQVGEGGHRQRQRHLLQATTSEPPVAILAPLPLATVGERNGGAARGSPWLASTMRSASMAGGCSSVQEEGADGRRGGGGPDPRRLRAWCSRRRWGKEIEGGSGRYWGAKLAGVSGRGGCRRSDGEWKKWDLAWVSHRTVRELDVYCRCDLSGLDQLGVDQTV